MCLGGREARMQEALPCAARYHAAPQRDCSEKGTFLRSGDSIDVIVIRDVCCGMHMCSGCGATCLLNAHSGCSLYHSSHHTF